MKWLDKYQSGGEFLGTTDKGFNYNGAWGGPAQNGKKVETPTERAKRTAKKTAQETTIGLTLSKIPYAETLYDAFNTVSSLKGGDMIGVGSNFLGSLIPGISGKAIETIAQEYVPKQSEASKKAARTALQLSPAENMKYLKKYGPGFTSNPEFLKNEGRNFKQGGIINDDRGQWAHPGEVTRINSNNITMKGVNFPVLGISNTGDKKIMKPGKNYKFKGASVTEYPMIKNGGELTKLDQLTNFTNYNTQQPGGWLDKF